MCVHVCVYLCVVCICMCADVRTFTSKRFLEVLEDFGLNDWDLSSCMCKTLWNLSDTLTLSVLCFDIEETDLIPKQFEANPGEQQNLFQ